MKELEMVTIPKIDYDILKHALDQHFADEAKELKAEIKKIDDDMQAFNRVARSMTAWDRLVFLFM